MKKADKKYNLLELLKKYSLLLLPLIYFPIYMTCFSYLEEHISKNYYIIHLKVDDLIPFVEYFIVPYYLWFLYVAVSVICIFFLNRTDYLKLCLSLAIGMTLFLIISYLIPNGQNLRPIVFPRNNIFTDLVRILYKADTPTNIFPSIHCYNSIMVHTAINSCEQLKKYTKLRTGSFILCILIIMSTVFLKQHSMFDVITAFMLSAVVYLAVYRSNLVKLNKPSSDFVESL